MTRRWLSKQVRSSPSCVTLRAFRQRLILRRDPWLVRHGTWMIFVLFDLGLALGCLFCVLVDVSTSVVPNISAGFSNLAIAAVTFAIAVLAIAIPLATSISDRHDELYARTLVHRLPLLLLTLIAGATLFFGLLLVLLPLPVNWWILMLAGVTGAFTLGLLVLVVWSTRLHLQMMGKPLMLANLVADWIAADYAREHVERLYNGAFIERRDALLAERCNTSDHLVFDKRHWWGLTDEASNETKLVLSEWPLELKEGYLDVSLRRLRRLDEWLAKHQLVLQLPPHFASTSQEAQGKAPVAVIGKLCGDGAMVDHFTQERYAGFQASEGRVYRIASKETTGRHSVDSTRN